MRAILEDDAGRLWVGTTDGLDVVLPYAGGVASYRAGERSDQLSDNYIMSLYQDRGGVLWVGTRTGGVNTWNARSWDLGHFQADWLQQQSVSAIATDSQTVWVGTFGGGLTKIDRSTGGTDASAHAPMTPTTPVCSTIASCPCSSTTRADYGWGRWPAA